jgi:predicted transcriptional regulator
MLQVLWERGEATRRQVVDALYPGGGEAHYATVQKLLARLEAKGLARHKRSENVLIFQAAVDRDEFLRRRLQALADRLCGGAVAPMVMNLVRAQSLSKHEVEELYELIREHRRKAAKSAR